jgi:hypothetical protein
MSSVQFRSRIKPAFDYSDTLNSYGVCCSSTGVKTVRSFTECFNEDGNIDSVSCPDSDTRLGCCCSCSYVTPGDITKIPTLTPNGEVASGGTPYLTSGFRSNVSRCDCERLGGKWSDRTCPDVLNNDSNSSDSWQSLCRANNLDVRAPRSCCHLEFDENTGWPTGIKCKDVCTSQDCALLSTEVYPSYFGSNRCEVPLVVGDATTNCVESEVLSILSTRSSMYTGFELGSCYTLEQNGDSLTYECALTPQILCDGYWVEQLDDQNAFCNSSYTPTDPQKVNGVYQPQSMSLSSFNAIGLTSGDNYQGGVYIGIFETPNNSSTSEVYGNINFGTPTLSKYYSDSVGTTYAKWAIIVNEIPYNVPYLTEGETQLQNSTSLWDGYYNTYGDGTFKGIQTNLTRSIAFQNRSGFIDYYLPSIYELHFYSAYLRRNNIENKGVLLSSSVFNAKYVSSYNKTMFGSKSLVYGQSVLSANNPNHKTVLIDKYTPQTVLFFRKILLT